MFVQALLAANTDAGSAVFSPYDWPTAGDAYPALLVHARKERKESLGRNAPLFDVTATLEVIGRTRSPALLGDAGSAVALEAAERLKMQIEIALINNPAVWVKPDGTRRVSQFASVDSDLATSSEGEMPIGSVVMQFEVEFTQGPEDFFPIVGTPLEGFDARVQEPPGTVEPGFSITFPPFIQS